MIPVRAGDRGPAVEDIQRRLRTLGHDLGRAGVDGIFLGATARAVEEFQRSRGLAEDGWVGDETWSALVDATFHLGDRTLYLRVPHFHGADVRTLQQALNVLGFACGEIDSIFGTFTERAVRDFQRNGQVPVGGIVGVETVRQLDALRHAWEGKEPVAHSQARAMPARSMGLLRGVRIAVCGSAEACLRIAERFANLALAIDEVAQVAVAGCESSASQEADIVLVLESPGMFDPTGDEVDLMDPSLAVRMRGVLQSRSRVLRIAARRDDRGGEVSEQRAAIRLLDAVCVALEDALKA